MLKEISIEIIRKCPNNCLHCSSMSNRHCVEYMPLEKFKEVVIDAAELGAKTICFSGGEPFLHSEIEEMVNFVFNKGLNCYIYTSGIVFSNNTFTSISTEFLSRVRNNVSKLIFNLEAAKESTYDMIMGTKGCFSKVKQSIMNANNCNITTEIHFVPMKPNMSEIKDVVELSEKLGVSKISFLRLVVHGRAQRNKDIIALTNEEYKNIKEELKTLQSESKISIRIGVPLSDGNTCYKCEAAKGKLNIKYDGTVFPCEVFKNADFSKTLPNLLPMNIYSNRLKTIYEQSNYLICIRNISEEFIAQKHLEACIGQELIKRELAED